MGTSLTFLDIDKPFAKDDPTINPPISPGPNVAAIAEILEKLIFLIDYFAFLWFPS